MNYQDTQLFLPLLHSGCFPPLHIREQKKNQRQRFQRLVNCIGMALCFLFLHFYDLLDMGRGDWGEIVAGIIIACGSCVFGRYGEEHLVSRGLLL